MRRLVNSALRLILVLAGGSLMSCQQSPNVPSEIGTVEDLVQALRPEGLTVSESGEIPANRMGFFTVPAKQILVSAERLSAFDYPTADRAAADAALISSDAQPNPLAAIGSVSRPQFYSSLTCDRALCRLLDGDYSRVREVARATGCDRTNTLSLNNEFRAFSSRVAGIQPRRRE